jgi:hypothetical protein
MPHVLIRHKVADWEGWKPVYDAHASARAAAGLKEEHLFRNADNPHEVILLFTAENLDKARAFAKSADLRDKMQIAGVMDQPDIYFLN